MSDFFDVRKTNSSDNFDKKAKMLGTSMEKQVEILNNNYMGKVEFCISDDLYSGEKHIEVSWINPDIRILELPEVDNLHIGYIKGCYFDESDILKVKYAQLGTIKLPKTIKSFKIRSLSHMPNLTSIWLWDTTELDLEKHGGSNIKMVVIQRTDGGKPIVHRL